jgi:hypothetical protein
VKADPAWKGPCQWLSTVLLFLQHIRFRSKLLSCMKVCCFREWLRSRRIPFGSSLFLPGTAAGEGRRATARPSSVRGRPRSTNLLLGTVLRIANLSRAQSEPQAFLHPERRKAVVATYKESPVVYSFLEC